MYGGSRRSNTSVWLGGADAWRSVLTRENARKGDNLVCVDELNHICGFHAIFSWFPLMREESLKSKRAQPFYHSCPRACRSPVCFLDAGDMVVVYLLLVKYRITSK